MPLIHYSTYVFLPGGNPAADMELTVYLTGGNVAVPLRADKAGTTPLANPVMTNADGLVAFYAPPADYSVWIAGTVWPLTVDPAETDPAWPGTFIHTQSTPATTWTIDHWFGIEPSTTVLVDGQRAEADVQHPDGMTTVLTFGAPTPGVAYLRR